MNNRKSILAVLFVSALAVSSPVWAAPVIPNSVDIFDATYAPWQALGGATIDNQVNQLDFTIDTVGGFPGDGWVHTVDADFTGDYMADVGPTALINFTFTGSSNADQLSLYFYSSTDNATWYYPLSLSDGGHSVLIGNSSGWVSFDPSPDYSLAITDVDRIGVYVANSALGPYSYALDNFELTFVVPEPETVWMILAVVLSLGITFRGRILELAGSLKARLAKN